MGSHCARLLARRYDVVVLDDLSRGHEWAVLEGRLVVGRIDDRKLLEEIFEAGPPVHAVFHFAARSLVGESMEAPLAYYSDNVGATAVLLETAVKYGVGYLIFSSSAAVYGEPRRVPITEDAPLQPSNPYGFTKMAVERMLADCERAHGLRYTALRYFNAAGAADDAAIGEDHRPETHLIPILLDAALGRRSHVCIFGTDYPTRDGTCIRDYVHVEDLARAHLNALRRLERGEGSFCCNLGNGEGFSVKEVIECVRRVTGRDFEVREAPRRPGDPAVLVASSALAGKELDWRPARADLEDIVESAWRWHEKHFGGACE